MMYSGYYYILISHTTIWILSQPHISLKQKLKYYIMVETNELPMHHKIIIYVHRKRLHVENSRSIRMLNFIPAYLAGVKFTTIGNWILCNWVAVEYDYVIASSYAIHECFSQQKKSIKMYNFVKKFIIE